MKELRELINEADVDRKSIEQGYKVLDYVNRQEFNADKNGHDIINHELVPGDVVAIVGDKATDLKIAVITKVSQKAAYFVTEYRGKRIETYVAPNRVAFLYHSELFAG